MFDLATTDFLDFRDDVLARAPSFQQAFSNAFTRKRGLEPTSIPRQVTVSRKTIKGVITQLCNPAAHWSSVSVAQAVAKIESGLIQYFTLVDGRFAIIHVVDDTRA